MGMFLALRVAETQLSNLRGNRRRRLQAIVHLLSDDAQSFYVELAE